MEGLSTHQDGTLRCKWISTAAPARRPLSTLVSNGRSAWFKTLVRPESCWGWECPQSSGQSAPAGRTRNVNVNHSLNSRGSDSARPAVRMTSHFIFARAESAAAVARGPRARRGAPPRNGLPRTAPQRPAPHRPATLKLFVAVATGSHW